jgi:hypothetical protein
MSTKDEAEKAQAQILRDIFEGIKGRPPESDQELKEWLATDEGKEATIFEPASVSRWGEIGRS